jgi:shikimate dehydrogenase
MMNHTYQVLSRKKNNLDKLTQLNGENYFIINALAREFTPVLNSATGGTFWDLNYSQSYEEELQKNKLIKYRDGLELLSLQASFALSFWNLKAD